MEKPGLKYQESVSAFFKLFSRKLYNLPHLLLAVSVTNGDSFGLSLHDSKPAPSTRCLFGNTPAQASSIGGTAKRSNKMGIRLSIGQNLL